MAAQREPVRPRTFFLNETHELSSYDKAGGGRAPEYVGISWAGKAARLSDSIDRVLQAVRSSRDPLRDDRYFVVARPVSEVEKRSKDKRKAPLGIVTNTPDFGASDGKVFERLGLDLLQVTNQGDAVVHGDRERLEQLLQRTRSLDALGTREQSRWVTIDTFGTVPPQLRVDAQWLSTLQPNVPADVVFELQPVLGRVDADSVLRAIADILGRRQGEQLSGTGTDFSGRFWFRGKATQDSIRAVAKDFYSVQAIHSPLFSIAAAASPSRELKPATQVRMPQPDTPLNLPCVAVVDLGVPTDHKQLARYRRGQFVPQDAMRARDRDHGAFVASRVVFGETASPEQLSAAVGRCSFYDAVVGDGYSDRISDKVVMDAVRGVRGAAPDVRVFNLSIGDTRPIAAFSDVEQREKRLLMQDLDNFIFANDVVVVVAAGNSVPGAIPRTAYPAHADEPSWALGPWACGFNTLVCGSFVAELSIDGLVTTPGWPSPFSRVGPGLCDAPVPSFGAPGGNSDADYRMRPGLGVLGFSGAGLIEDRAGTSHAAPILSSEAALAFNALQQYCTSGTQPFGVLVRAFLALVARATTTDSQVLSLLQRTIGLGSTSATRLSVPASGSAVILWQGIIETSKDIVRVQLPIPSAWLAQAQEPVLRLVISYDPPVNESAKALWACRKVNAVLRPGPEAKAVRAPNRLHESYPLFDRDYRLSSFSAGGGHAAEGDLWLLEFTYEEKFDYPPGMEFDPRQRVAFAAELVDRGATPVDPQPSMQQLPIAASMTRLSVQSGPIRTPVIVRTRN